MKHLANQMSLYNTVKNNDCNPKEKYVVTHLETMFKYLTL